MDKILLLITNILLIKYSLFYTIPLAIQLIIYLIAVLKYLFRINNGIINYISYYCMTVLAQFIGVLKIIARKNKPFWEKAESTR